MIIMVLTNTDSQSMADYLANERKLSEQEVIARGERHESLYRYETPQDRNAPSAH